MSASPTTSCGLPSNILLYRVYFTSRIPIVLTEMLMEVTLASNRNFGLDGTDERETQQVDGRGGGALEAVVATFEVTSFRDISVLNMIGTFFLQISVQLTELLFDTFNSVEYFTETTNEMYLLY